MIAIHNSNSGFHKSWEDYCKGNSIPYKIVNCYSNTLIDDLRGCKGLMWHFHQNNPIDIIIAKQILFALEHTGFKTFPNFKTAWHFDDKVGQKYLFEMINAPLVPSFVFYNKKEALKWIDNTILPKVFKLRGGAGSSNVKLITSKKQAKSLIKKAFGSGISNYDAWGSLKERWMKYRMGKMKLIEPLKGLLRFISPPPFAKALGKELNYVYFQEFIKNNDSDTRIIVIDGKAFALKRYVRKGDFRASGSGNFDYKKDLFDERCIKIAFDLTNKLQIQCAAYDFVFNENNEPLIVEISYGYIKEGYYPCPGYWDENLNWFEGSFNHEGWMVELFLKQINGK